jgi:hypothetical protein
MALLSRDEILSKDDLQRELVPVPEWGGEVYISAMSGSMRDAWEQTLVSEKASMENIRARLVVVTAVDEQGAPLFSAKDAVALGRKSSAALDRCVRVAQRLNRLTASDLDDLAKN